MNQLFSKIQTLTGATRRELLLVALLLLGLLLGALWREFRTPPLETRVGEEQSPSEISQLLDSIEQAERSTYTGTTPAGEPVPSLAEADTVVRRAFPRSSAQKIHSGTINLNTASKQELMKLPGVGEATAEKILQFRATQRFRHIEDVMQVPGIGTKKFMAMREFLTTH